MANMICTKQLKLNLLKKNRRMRCTFSNYAHMHAQGKNECVCKVNAFISSLFGFFLTSVPKSFHFFQLLQFDLMCNVDSYVPLG